MKSVSKALLVVAMSAMLAAALFVATASANDTSKPIVATASASCTAVNNIEAIVDDSGSMSFTDPDKLRVQAMNLLIQTLPPKTTFGAVEFGSGIEGIPASEFFPGYPGTPAAYTIFAPEEIAPNATAMSEALGHDINADDGATDYNAAFAKADSDNPNSQARIFITDGGHDEGTYNEAHLAHNVPTYVIGIGLSGGEEKARLKKIAGDTHGQVYEIQDSSEVQAAVNSIGAALTCQTPPRKFTDELSQGQSKTHTVTIGAKTKTLQVTLTWASPTSVFKLTGLRVKSKGKVVAVARPKPAPKPKKLSVNVKAKSSTYSVVTIGHLTPGTLTFGVKAAKASGAVKVTTQVGTGG
jgi:hypothetical protein